MFDLLTEVSFGFIEEVIFFRVCSCEGNRILLKDSDNRWLHHRQELVLITITSLSFCLLAIAVCSQPLFNLCVFLNIWGIVEMIGLEMGGVVSDLINGVW